jgi:RNA polymerase sigma-70 factor (ECF subfamily)
VGAVAGDRDEAEEAVQEAFVRLMGRWGTVRRYDDPEAWLRKVAFGFVSNRRRKVRNGVRAFVRHGAAIDEVPLSGDRVDLERALRSLPIEQRQVLVLVHVVGLAVDSAARELDIPVGTVKSRLARGRAALAPLLREGVADHA